ncbi:hypothetical protein TEA_029577 [Camellia sinensis var. sinensis]|uniref:Uncharacterized protein n=1 Tax=Camellia sinensis var. sinensis TaxID=542762 RepID=A0A4S4DP01_CAMSN|nr:hypothetical protein TEA_029577 [Camellia sinensis var. sinensis]
MLSHGMRGMSMAWPAGQGCSCRTTRPVASTIPLGKAEFCFAAHANHFRFSRRALYALGPPQGDKNRRGGTNRSDAGLNLSGSWQQGHSALSIPRRVFKSSTEDSTRRSRYELYFKAARAARSPRGLHQRHVPLGAGRPLLRVGKRAAGACVASSPDFDLEAFSHNTAHVDCSLPGEGPRGAVPNPSPGRHAATRSRRGSSSTSPPTADGFGTGTPVPSRQSQSFSQSYRSILPTSLAYIVPSTRGCSPWRPDAVMSTTGRGRHAVLRIFKGRRGRTGHHATCGSLPAAGPYLRLSRFQGGQAVKQKR